MQEASDGPSRQSSYLLAQGQNYAIDNDHGDGRGGIYSASPEDLCS